MAPTIVAIDLETTGLDPRRDAIIEIGAVKFRGDRIEAEYQTLINPRRSIPAFVSQLTGISDAMVAGAPRLAKALPAFQAFVGASPVLGHNVRFDLRFLRGKQAFWDNEVLDTYDLAAVLLPAAARYSLGALAAFLHIPLPASHRALDDARVTKAVYQELFGRALALPLDLLAEIVHLGQDVHWGGGWPFQAALRARAAETFSGRRRVSPQGLVGPLFHEVDRHAPGGGLQPADPPSPLDLQELSALFAAHGRLAQSFEPYEHRPQQIQMMRAVARAFSESQHLLVEAGTGTGKSLAYLIPAIRWAVQNGRRVVVSTNTINLQDQLLNKDLPALQAALDTPFSVALLKGRANYICPRRLESLRRRGPNTVEELRVLAKLLVWLPDSHTGDRTEITLTGPAERDVWARLSAQDEGCTTDRCATQLGGSCPFYRARRRAENAHILVVNHALLLADVAAENRILPEYDYLVVDEAHHLEAATTDGLSFVARQADVERRLRDLGGPNSGLLGRVLASCADALPPAKIGRLEDEINTAFNAISTALVHTGDFFERVQLFMRVMDDGRGSEYDQRTRLAAAKRSCVEWEEVEIAWGNVESALAPVVEALARLARGLAELDLYDIEGREDLMTSLGATARHLDELVTQLTRLVSQPSDEQIYWVEMSGDGRRLSLHAAPLAVGALVEQHLWNAKSSVVMTSATLTTAGDFDYLRGRLNAHSAQELAVGSPFDFKSSTLVYIPTDIPEPYDRGGHQRALEQGLLRLCAATHGRTLVLFTSIAQLRQTAQAIRGQLEREDIVVYDQSSGSSRHHLLESFSAGDRSVLLGTRSFWEGVDVPGEALSVLVIAKLPFDVPSDPIVAARSETFESPFFEYSVPEAILRFRQGFGRLIRTQSDRGVVVIFDRRILTKKYGRLFLDSLPECERVNGPLQELPEYAVEWIDGRRAKRSAGRGAAAG